MRIKDLKIQIGDLAFYGDKIISFKGLEEVVSEYETVKNAYGNGELVIGAWTPTREIEIIAEVEANSLDRTLRYFKQNKEYLLIINDRKIKVRRESIAPQRISWHHNPRIVLNLVAFDPYFYDVSDFGKNIAGIVPTFGFPWVSTVEDGFSFGYMEFTDKTIFTNTGDDQIGAKFRVEARGSVEGFKIENLKTGEFLKVNQNLKQGDVLEISTVYENTFVKLNGENVFQTVSNDSSIMRLDIGDNYIQYDADVGKALVDVFMYYTPKYAQGLEDIEI